MRNFFIILFMIFTTSCDNNVPIWKRWIFQHPPRKHDGSLNYPKMYTKGWQDGCETAGGATANHLYKKFFEYTKNEELFHTDTEYKTGWNNAFRYCTSYLLQHNFDWFGKRVV